MIRRASLLALAVILGLAALPIASTAQQQGPGPDPEIGFPHGTHAGLFPLCTGCHTGVPTGDREAYFPTPETCTNCHDGGDLQGIEWEGPQRRASNLAFRHTDHARAAADETPAVDCGSCHSNPGADRMEQFHRTDPSQCLSCHGSPSDQHFAGVDCTSCHVPIASSGFGLARLESLAIPADHDRGDFLASAHGQLAVESTSRCATCHTQDRCASCHVNAAWVDEIQAVPPAPANMLLPVVAVHYSTPDSHGSWEFMDAHGAMASRDACSTCHTQNDCTACHVSPAPGSAQALPTRPQVVAPGVGVERSSPGSHDSPFFLQAAHATLASSDGANCAACHTEESCVLCHSAPIAPTYHPANFAQQHPAQAYSQTQECQNCHSQEEFCRACHVQQGITSRGRLGPGYHDGQAVWLFQHGKAARQQLETCTSCHTQGDCMQCHSIKGAFKVNPHGPDFDAELASKKNAQICLACHLEPPVR